MAVKMRKWSPWPPASAAGTRKFQVVVKPIRLHGLPEIVDGDDAQRFVAIKMKWKGEPKLFPLMAPFQPRPKKEFSSQKVVNKGSGFVQWDEEDDRFENTCCFSIVSNHGEPKFGAWEIAFNVLCSEKMDSKAKMSAVVIGRVSVNLSEIASKIDEPSIEQMLPLSLQIDGISREALLTVLFNSVEIRDSEDSVAITRDVHDETVKARRRSLSQEDASPDDSDDQSSTLDAKEASQTILSANSKPLSVSGNGLASDKKEGWFSWKSRHFSFKRAKTKEDNKCDDNGEGCIDENKVQVDLLSPVPASEKDDPSNLCTSELDDTEGAWEEKELVSRDGQVKLTAPIFFASFDQRSHKASGESACTALVAVISHWLHSNPNKPTPDRSELNSLIINGSSEWRKLCEDATYVNDFPNKHFDLETVLRAGVRPINISHSRSFVGFFGAEKFESLKGVMSFDDIWNGLATTNGPTPRIYVVSWNDHFFVLKVDSDAYYIIDTLGERLYEGCHQAYILRFDENAVMRKTGDGNIEDETICSGKECCREFIKRFFAAIPLKELEEEEKKEAVSYFSLHHRLQIEFNYSYLSSSSSNSSLTSSPFSSLTTSASSLSSEREYIRNPYPVE